LNSANNLIQSKRFRKELELNPGGPNTNAGV